MMKYLPHILIISFVFLLAPTAHVASYAGWIEDDIEDAKKEVRKNPDDAVAHFNLGKAYGMSVSHQDESERSYKQAIWIDPEYAEAHYYLGMCNDSDKATQKRAIKHYNYAIMYCSDDDTGFNLRVRAHYKLGLVFINLSRDRWAANEQIKKLQDLGAWKSATRLKGMILTELD